MTTTIERKKFDHQLEVNLTDEDYLEKLLAQVAIERELDDVRSRKAVAMAEFSQEIREKNKVRGTLLEAINSRKEKRTIECYLERDDRRGMMRTLRCDNDELIDERALTIDERDEGKQKQLPFVADAAAPPPGPPPDIDENAETEDTDGDPALGDTLDRFEAGESDAPDEDDDEDD